MALPGGEQASQFPVRGIGKDVQPPAPAGGFAQDVQRLRPFHGRGGGRGSVRSVFVQRGGGQGGVQPHFLYQLEEFQLGEQAGQRLPLYRTDCLLYTSRCV